jgi:hypothetical protein
VSSTIVHISSGPSTAEFIVSVLVAGLLGPALAAMASKWSDGRRFKHENTLKAGDFEHERKLKASDDFIERIDDVTKSLDELCEACSKMRVTAALFGPDNVETLKAVQNAELAHIRTRTLSARLKLRPHADVVLVESALAAATSVNAAIENVRNTNRARQQAARAAGQPVVIGGYDDKVVESQAKQALEHIEEFQSQARSAIGRLLS